MRPFLIPWATFLCLFLAGCKHSVQFETVPSGGYLTIDGQSLGKISQDGLSAQMSSGFGAVPYRLVYVDGYERSGMMPRSQVDGVLTALALTGPILCAPMLCGLGVCVVNPGWGVALLSGSVASAGACQGLMTVASPWTLPAASCLGTLGFLPAGLLLKAERLPSRVTFPKVPASKGFSPGVMLF